MAEEKDIIAKNAELARQLGEQGIDISLYTPDPKTGLLTMEAFIKRSAEYLRLLQRTSGRAGICLAKFTATNTERYGAGAVDELWRTVLQILKEKSRANEPATALPEKAWLFLFWPEEQITSAIAAAPITRVQNVTSEVRNLYPHIHHKVYAYKFRFPPLEGAKVDAEQMVREGIAWLMNPENDALETNEDIMDYFPKEKDFPEEGENK